MGKLFTDIAPEAQTCLKNRHWTGNVRELKNVIERAVLIEDGPLVTLNGLTSNTTGNTETVLQSNPPVEIGMPTEHKREQLKPLDQVVSDHIIKVLDTTNGRIEGTQGASAILDINPSTLRSKMRKLNISWEKKDDST